jgi:hypothetical protein
MKSMADADQCGTYLTPEQQAALAPPKAPEKTEESPADAGVATEPGAAE